MVTKACQIKADWLVALLLIVAAVAPAATADEYWVSPKTGNDANPGTRQAPWQTLAGSVTHLKPGDTCNLAPGVYRQDRLELGPAGQDFTHLTTFRFAPADNATGRAVLTGLQDQAPTLTFKKFVRIEGLWAGGYPTQKGAMVAFGQEGVQIVGCTFFGHGYQLLAGNTSKNVLIQDCHLVHMGQGWFGHPIYLSGGPAPTSQDIRVIGNTFIDGQGFAIHGWHDPQHLTIVGNFTAGHMCGMVTQGPGHVVHHNVFWKPNGRINADGTGEDWKWCALLPNDVLRFDHNLCWSPNPIREGGQSLAPPVENYTMPGAGGTQVRLQAIPEDQLPQRVSWFPHREAEVDAAVAYISWYFRCLLPDDFARDVTGRVEQRFKLLKVAYQPTPEDIASRPLTGPVGPPSKAQ